MIIQFENVSKHFVVKRDRRNSFQERLIGLFKPHVMPNEEFWALRDVSFAITKGETIGLIGHNGSGKSTTLKLITQILEPTHGRVIVDGRISALLELGSGFHPELTGRENIFLNGSLLGIGRTEMGTKIRDIISFSELEEFIDMPVKHYSSGMYMRLGFAVAISVDPDILITDEVLAVGDEAFQRKCMDRIYALKKRGKTILFVSHGLGQVRDLCDRALWFDHGKLLIDSEPTVAIDAYLSQTNQRDAARLQAEAAEEAQQPIEETTASEGPPLEPEENLNRWGDYAAEIVKVELLSAAGEPIRSATTGDSLTVRMHYQAHSLIEDPVFGLAIHNRNGLHINGPNTRWGGLEIPSIRGAGFIDYTIPNLPLLEGDYEITVAIYDHTTTRAHDHHDRMYMLKVYTPSIAERFGTVYIPSEWSWQPRSRS